MSSKILLRRGTAAQWSSANPILGIGELGIETDTLKIKIGNGTSTWSQLSSYANVTPSQLTSEINNLINAAPSTLDTLNELAAAINNDASFSTTVNNLLTGKVSKSGGDTITASTASTVGLVIQGAASQTANLQQWKNSAGTTLGNFDKNGILTVIDFSAGAVNATWRVYATAGNSSITPMVAIGAVSQTADLQQWQNSAATVLAKVDANGSAQFLGLNVQGTGSGIVNIGTAAAGYVGLIIKSVTSQTANFQEWQNSSGSVLASISSNGAFATAQGIVATGNYASSFGGGVIGGVIVTVKANSASNKALVVQGAASQTANLQEWQNSSGTVLSKINYDGVLASKVSLGDFWGPIWETVTAGSNDQGWKKLVVISLPDNNYSGIQFKIDINNAVTNFGSSAYPEKSTYTVAATRAGGALNDSVSMILTGPEGDKYIRGMKLSNSTYEIQFRQPSDWTEVVVRVQPISAQPYLRGLSDLYTFYPMSAGGTAASTGGTVYTPVVGGTDKFSFLSAQSFAKIGGTSSQFLKADGSVDASTYMTTAMPYVAGHHAEGRYLASAALMNDLGNARLRGSTFTFTNVSPTNAQIDTMFDGTAGVVVWTTSGITFPVVIEFTLPRTLQYGATVGVGFGNATWRANSVKIEAFSNGAWVTCIDTTTNTSEDVIANIPGSNATPGTTKLRYTFANPNSVQFRICHLWGFNYNSDMWTQLQMPRAGGTMYGSLAVQGYTQTLGTTNVVQNVIRGVSGQTSNLAEWQNSAGSVVASIAPDGTSTLGSLYITAGTHKIYGPVEVLTNSSGNANLSLIGFGVSSSTNLTIGIKNTDSVNNRNWQLIVGGGNYSGQSGNWIGEGGLIFQENNPNDSSQVVRGGFRRGGQFALGGANTYSASLSITPLSTSTIGQVVRANASQTASLQEWQLSDGSAAYTIDSNGHMFSGTSRGLYLNTGYISGTRFAIASVGASQIGMIIRGNTSQTGNLTEWRNVSDTVLASIDANGQGAFKSTTLTASSSGGNALTLVAASGQTAPLLSTAGGAKITAGGNYFEAPGIQSNYIMTATAGNSTIVPLTVYGAASQTANLQEWKDSTGTLLSAVSNVGTVRSPIFASTTSGVTYIATNFDTSGIAIITNGAAMKGLVIRGVASQTASLQEWQDSTGTLLGRFHPTAGLLIGGVSNINGGGAPYMNFGTTNFSLYPNTASNIGLIIKGAASQTANLQEWQDSSGNILTQIRGSGGQIVTGPQLITGTQLAVTPLNSTTTGILVRGSASQSNDLQQWQNSAGTVITRVRPDGQIGIGSTLITSTNFFVNNTISTTHVVATIRGAASQTADLQQWQNSAGTVLSKVDSLGAIYLINPNPSANSGAITSPSINFQGSIWNNAYGSQTIKGAINVTEYLGNTNPTISKMAFLLATDNGTPAEVASFTNTGAFSNIGGLDAYGSSVIFRLRNTTDATTLAHTPSPKLELMGRAWNSSQGSAPTRAYLQVNANNINSDPFINRLGFFVATGNNAGGWIYGADATEYMSILGNGTVGINSTTPLATLDVRPASASNKAILVRGASSQTGNLTEWQDSSGNVLARIAANGVFYTGNGGTYISSNGDTFIQGSSATAPYTQLVVKGATSQTGNLQEWQNSAGSILTSISATGKLTITNTSASAALLEVLGTGGGQFVISQNGGISTNGGFQSIGASSYFGGYGGASNVVVNVTGASGQTGDLQRWTNFAGTTLAKITASGSLELNGKDIELMNIMGAY